MRTKKHLLETVFTYNTASKKKLQQSSEWRRCDKEERKKTWQTKDRQGSRKMETKTGRTATGLRSRDRQQDYTESKRQRVLQEDSEQKTGRKTTKSKRQRVLQEDKNKRQAERLQRVKDR